MTIDEQCPYTWTSADAAELPIFPGLARYDEVAAGAIRRALRFTVPTTQEAFVLPASHWASSNESSSAPAMGLRLRLKSDFDISGYPADDQVILTCLKTYGMILADNGSAIFITGTPDSRWNNDDLALSIRLLAHRLLTGAILRQRVLPVQPVSSEQRRFVVLPRHVT